MKWGGSQRVPRDTGYWAVVFGASLYLAGVLAKHIASKFGG